MKSHLKELFLLHFINDGVRTTLIVLLPFIAKDLSLSFTQAGFLGSSQALLGAILAIPTGYLIGRFGSSSLIFSLLLIYSLSTLGIAFSFNGNLLFLLYFTAAVGFGMFHTVGFALTASNSNQSNVGRNMGNFTAIGEIGRVAVPPIAVLITGILGWRITFVALGVIGIIFFLLSRFLSAPKNTHNFGDKDQNPQTYKEFLQDLVLLFKNKKAGFISLSAILDSLASSPIYVFLPFLLLSKHISAIELSIAMAVFFIGSLLGKTLLGMSVDKLGNMKVFILSELGMTASLIFISQNNHYLLLLLFSCLLGVFTKGTSPVVQTLFSELTDKNHYHKVFAVSEMFIGFAAVVGIILMGLLADMFDIKVIFYLAAFLAMLAIFPIFGLLKMTNKSVLRS